MIGRLCNLILLAFASCAFDVRRTQPLIFWIPVELASPPIVRYMCCLFNIFFCRTSAFLAPEFSHRYIPITLVRSRKNRWCNSSFFESTELFDLGERINFELFLRRVLSLRWRFWPTLLGRYFIVSKRCYTGQIELKHRTKTQINTRAQLFEEHYYRLNPVLNFNLDFSFFSTKAFSRVIFAILQFRNIPSPHCRQK